MTIRKSCGNVAKTAALTRIIPAHYGTMTAFAVKSVEKPAFGTIKYGFGQIVFGTRCSAPVAMV
jgi:hypothetical protein